jgi:hypothetical protein
MTPEAPAQKIICETETCGKVYKTRSRMLTHMKKVHKPMNPLPSPLRLALFHRREADEEGEEEGEGPSIQGNSNGEVNVLKVVSEGRFICSVCDYDFPRKEEVLRHVADIHGPVYEEATTQDTEEDMTGDEDVLEEACELYEALEAMTNELKEDDNTDVKEDLIEKLERFKLLVNRKSEIQKNTTDEVTNLRQVEQHQKKEIEKKEKEIMALKRAATKEKEKVLKEIKTLQLSQGELHKENSNLQAKLKEKESFIKSLEEQLCEEDEVNNDTSVVEMASMNKNTSGHACVACKSRFSTNHDLEKHIKDKHTEVDCPFCNKTFPNNNKLKGHVNSCIDNRTAQVHCNKCSQAFTRFEMKRHKQQCQKKMDFKCEECGLIGSTEIEISSHMRREHEQQKSREICYHYRNGFCFRGESCKFSHVGFQKKTSESTARTSTSSSWTPACNKGDGCSWLARGACRYFHRGVGVQRPYVSQPRTNQTSARREDTRTVSINAMSGFPPLRRGNQHARRNGRQN